MNEQVMRYRIGVFVLAAMLLLGVLVMLFGRWPALFTVQDRYSIIFDVAPGVAKGTPVRRSGVRIGEVEKVELDDVSGKVRVTIVIDRPHVLFQNDQPVLVSGALSGDTSIDLIPRPTEPKPATTTGPPDRSKSLRAIPVSRQLAQAQPAPAQPPERVPVKPGTEFQGLTQADVATLLKQVSQVTPSAQQALTELSKSLERIDQMTPLMQETLREYRDLAKTTRDTIPELRRTNDEILVTARNWSRLGERLDNFVQTNQDKFVKTLENLNDTIGRVANVFNDENQKNVATTLRNASAASKNLETLTHDADDLIKESRSTVKRLNDSLGRTDEILTNLQQATRPMAERSGTILKNLDESVDRLNRTLAEAQEILRAFNQEDGALRRFIADPALYNNLNDAACMLTKTLPRVDRILRDVEVFADKIARHPESLGIGGAVRPSSGLKESPTTPMFWQRPAGH